MSTAQNFFTLISEGRIEKVREAVTSAPDLVNAANEDGIAAVMFSLYQGKNEITKLLIDRGARLDLFEAAAVGAQEHVEQSLKHNPDAINSFSPDGWTPLHLAVFFGRVNVVHYLLSRGADINAVSGNEQRVTPLHSALANPQNSAVGQLLIGAGAELDIKQAEGYTPLHYAAANGLDQVVRSLLAHGVDTGIRNHQGKTAYELALERGKTSTAGLLEGA